MKKPKFKLLKEFKDFISRGSVLDLAVGMIIGAAFTAIITAVVSGILQPLINWIPLSPDGTGLITVLRDPVFAEDGTTIVTEALVIDWGSVISAVITFLLTAIVLFAIVKAINVAKNGASKIKKAVEHNEAEAPAAEAEAPVAEAPAAEPVVEEKMPDDETVALLKEIRDLLRQQAIAPQAAAEKAETVAE